MSGDDNQDSPFWTSDTTDLNDGVLKIAAAAAERSESDVFRSQDSLRAAVDEALAGLDAGDAHTARRLLLQLREKLAKAE